MNYILFEDFSHHELKPFTFTRPVFALRSGIFTMQERWERVLGKKVLGFAVPHLQTVFGAELPDNEHIWINGKLAPDEALLDAIQGIAPSEYVFSGKELLVARFAPPLLGNQKGGSLGISDVEALGLKAVEINWQGIAIRQMPDIFHENAALIRYDFELITKGRKSNPITDPHSRIYGADNIFVEEGVKIRAAIINAEDGPIYFGKGVEVEEGAIIHGTHAFGEGATAKMGAKLRGDSSFGPHVKVGGEVGNSVIMGYSSKGHDGYLGNSVLGYWCNLGADTNTSNLKNNYAEVRIWNYQQQRFAKTGTQFCGLMMGDHSKCGINTMFNTGTVVGVAANIFGAGFPRNFIPSFSWGGHAGLTTYRLNKVFEVAELVMQRRNMELSQGEKDILTHVFEETTSFRTWDKKD
jgi:UDP-N-acetylglucosamine diphosphorylase/glucosamine-1-phosphate N-acetyltransferase